IIIMATNNNNHNGINDNGLTELKAVVQSKMNEIRIAFNKTFRQFELERQQFQREKDNFQRQKDLIKTMNINIENNEQNDNINDVIQLNVGGEKLCTLRSTLTLIPNSSLSTMFNGQWDNKLPRDHDGLIFLDYDPLIFKLILNQLRELNGCLENELKLKLPITLNDETAFKKLCRQLGIDKYIDQGLTERFHAISSNQNDCFIKLEENGLLAYVDDTIQGSWPEIRGKQLYSTGIHHIQLKIEKLTSTNMIFGITSSTIPLQQNAYNTKAAYMWRANCSSVFVESTRPDSYGNYDGDIKQNDLIELKINCDERKIILTNKHRTNNQKQYEMLIDLYCCPFPWVFSLSLYSIDDKIRIINDI
ncbi:unnamed protein product, partial [Didymodactylos carnosus]